MKKGDIVYLSKFVCPECNKTIFIQTWNGDIIDNHICCPSDSCQSEMKLTGKKAIEALILKDDSILNCEINTPEMEQEVLKGAYKRFKAYDIEDKTIYAIFEHGHWWIKFYDTLFEIEKLYSVNDAEGIGSFNGFSFENID